MRFCSNCGSEVSLPFCSQCGTPTGLPRPGALPSAPESQQSVPEDEAFATVVRLPPGPADPAPPAPPPPPAYQPMSAPPQGPPPGFNPRPSGPVLANPFAGVTVRDIVTDVAASVLLLVSIALPWDLSRGRVEEVNDHWWVVLSVLISFASLVVPYVGRMRIVPPLTPAYSRLVKGALAAPLALSLLALFAVELVNLTDAAEGGLGTGAAMAAAGALLAAQPRSYDEAPQVETLWARARTALLWVGVVLLLGTLAIDIVRFVTSDQVLGDSFFKLAAWQVVLIVLAALLSAAIPWGLSFIAIWRTGPVVGGRVLTAAVSCFLFVSVFGRADDVIGGDFDASDVPLFYGVSIEKLTDEPGGIPQGAGLLFLVAAVAILVRRRNVAEPANASEWIATARVISLCAGVASFVALVLNGVGLALAAINDVSVDLSGQSIAALVVLALTGGIAWAIVAVLGRSDMPAVLAVALAGGWILLGFVFAGLTNGDSAEIGLVTLFTAVTITEVFLMFGVPTTVLVALLVPASVRAERGPLIVADAAPAHLPPPPPAPQW